MASLAMLPRLRPVVAVAAAGALLSGCATVTGKFVSSSPEERLRQAAAKSGANGFIRADAIKSQVYVTHSQGTFSMTNDGKIVPVGGVKTGGSGKPLPIEQLTAGMNERAKQSGCGKSWRLESQSAATGAVVQAMRCEDQATSPYRSWLNGAEVPEISTWDAASLDRLLAEMKTITGDRTHGLRMGADAKAGPWARFEAVGSDGSCVANMSRNGKPSPHVPLVSFNECSGGNRDGDKPLDLATLSGGKIEAAIQRACRELGISGSQVQSVSIRGADNGRVQLQLTTLHGRRPFAVVDIG